jgi:hypothetical protein
MSALQCRHPAGPHSGVASTCFPCNRTTLSIFSSIVTQTNKEKRKHIPFSIRLRQRLHKDMSFLIMKQLAEILFE